MDNLRKQADVSKGRPLDPNVRFDSRVNFSGPAPSGFDSPCWLWTGATQNGYAPFWVGNNINGKRLIVKAHRYNYERHIGPVPAGMQLDHLCRVRHCVNPAHLEVVTPRENVMRGETAAARKAAQTMCGAGLHELAGDNVLISKGCRRCRACKNEQQREAARRRRERRKKQAA